MTERPFVVLMLGVLIAALSLLNVPWQALLVLLLIQVGIAITGVVDWVRSR